jgi:hypothetical protein
LRARPDGGVLEEKNEWKRQHGNHRQLRRSIFFGFTYEQWRSQVGCKAPTWITFPVFKRSFFPMKVIVTGPSVVGAMKLQLGIMASCHRFKQQNGIDYTETFSPVIKPATICVILSLDAQFNWSIKQFDISNAFLHGHLLEDVFMVQT